MISFFFTAFTGVRTMASRRLAVEALENRTLLAADVTVGTGDVVPQEPLPGDANMDGAFDQSDLVQVLEAGKYLTGEQAKWEEGDWNGDGTFDQMDVVSALQVERYSGGVDSHVFAAKAHGRAELPHKSWGEIRITSHIDAPPTFTEDGLLIIPLTLTGSGIGTQTGPFDNMGEGEVYLDVSGAEPIVVGMEGDGYATARASGDRIYWHALQAEASPYVTVTYTGGTGRFEHVEGGFSYDYTPDPGNPPHILSYDYVGRGTITF